MVLHFAGWPESSQNITYDTLLLVLRLTELVSINLLTDEGCGVDSPTDSGMSKSAFATEPGIS
jgi:hypothetical protein